MPYLNIHSQPIQQLESLLAGQALVLTKEENGLQLKGVGNLEYGVAWLLSMVGIHYVTNTKQIEDYVIQFLDENRNQFHQEDITNINRLRDKILTGSKQEDHSVLKRLVSEIEASVPQAATPILRSGRPKAIALKAPTKPEIKVHLQEKHFGQEISVPIGESFAIELIWSPSWGYESWAITDLPPFLTQQEILTGDTSTDQNVPGQGYWICFVVTPTKTGKGDISVKLPCVFDNSREITQTFTINAH